MGSPDQHHERLDGPRYPDALWGEEVLIGSRIIAVADVLEVMSSHRLYRASREVDAAIEEIQEGSGSLYDASVVNAHLRLVREGNLHQQISHEGSASSSSLGAIDGPRSRFDVSESVNYLADIVTKSRLYAAS